MPQGEGRNNTRLSVRGIVAMLDSGGAKIVTQELGHHRSIPGPMEPHQALAAAACLFALPFAAPLAALRL